jgi:hypothetical protein
LAGETGEVTGWAGVGGGVGEEAIGAGGGAEQGSGVDVWRSSRTAIIITNRAICITTIAIDIVAIIALLRASCDVVSALSDAGGSR